MSLLLGNYEIYYIYRSSESLYEEESTPAGAIKRISKNDMTDGLSKPLLESVGYFGKDTVAYGFFIDNVLKSICFYWFGERYQTRAFWPLQRGEAKLVHIVTETTVRGKGIASHMITQSTRDMLNQGFTRLYARIWHSNTPSIRAFEKAGWARIALVIRVNPFRRSLPIRFTFGC